MFIIDTKSGEASTWPVAIETEPKAVLTASGDTGCYWRLGEIPQQVVGDNSS